jgi:glycosyltransferase involved in cell wall biosynthesis
MAAVPPASVIVINHNYGRFLGAAVDSALAQMSGRAEVVVVDDGSTDESREVLERYGQEIQVVYQQNAGPATAYNTGFAAASGVAICFLDADDMLAPDALRQAAALLRDPGIVKVHWALHAIDAAGLDLGMLDPPGELPEGDLRELTLREGPHSYETSPGSGKAWARTFLERVLPLPAGRGADIMLSAVAPLYGRIGRLKEPQGFRRLHGANNWADMEFDRVVEFDMAAFNAHCELVAEHCRALGIPCDPGRWVRGSWLRRRQLAARDIAETVPPGASFVLIDQAEWGMDRTAGRRAIPFPEVNGEWAGPPPNEEAALQELLRQQHAGATHVVVGWPAFWWLEHYAGLRDHLEQGCTLLIANDRLRVWELRPGSDD